MRTFWRVLWLALAAGLGLIAQSNPSAADIQNILKELGSITGLPPQRPVPFVTFTKPQLRAFLENRIKTLVPDAEIESEQLALRRFGLIPRDYDLKSGVLNLVEDQAAALYDEEKKRMVLLDLGNDALQQIALVHELAHALADQHFDLKKYIRGTKVDLTDDASLARSAVAEGQATWLMLEYTLKQAGSSIRSRPELLATVDQLLASQQAGQLADAPLYLKEQLLFPYVDGLRFQNSVITKLGNSGFSRVFQEPPASTRQILHVEAYLAHEASVAATLPPLPEGEWKEVTHGSLGEFDHRVLFQQFEVPAFRDVASGWRGAAFDLQRPAKDRAKSPRIILRYASVWESEAAAARAMAAYRKCMEGKWKQIQASPDDTGRTFSGNSEDGFFVLQREGLRVWAIEGLGQRWSSPVQQANK